MNAQIQQAIEFSNSASDYGYATVACDIDTALAGVKYDHKFEVDPGLNVWEVSYNIDDDSTGWLIRVTVA